MTETRDDPFDLQRFVAAQDGVIDDALAELRAGAKRSHWMWFVFPQLAGLGRSAMAQRYGIAGIGEARAYLAHPLLGPRLAQCCEAAIAVPAPRSAHAILGSPDDVKLQSCLTLFDAMAADSVFARGLARFFDGRRDGATLALLERA